MLHSAYLKLKIGLNSKVDNVIQRAEVAMDRSYNVNNSTVRNNISRMAKSVCEYGQLLKDYPRLDAFKMVGSKGSIICVGANHLENKYLMSILFPEGHEVIELGRILLWQLSAKTKEWLDEVDLMMLRVSRKFPYPLEAPYVFDNPVTIMQVLPLDKPLAELFDGHDKKGLRKRISRVKKANYTSRFSHSLEDFEFFYHRMYLPTLTNRFGDLAELTSYELLKSWMMRGRVLLVSLNDQVVAGALIYLENGTWFDRVTGLLDGNSDLLKQHELGTALYWFSIEHAVNRGAQRINFMESYAFCSASIFQAKSKWGTKVVADPWEHNKLVFAANHLSAEWRDHLNQVGFLTCVEGQHLRVCIDELGRPDNPADIEAKKEQALKSGLKGIQLVGPGYKQTYLG